MANKKVGVINNDNLDFFVGYISSGNRPKKIPGDIVEQWRKSKYQSVYEPSVYN